MILDGLATRFEYLPLDTATMGAGLPSRWCRPRQLAIRADLRGARHPPVIFLGDGPHLPRAYDFDLSPAASSTFRWCPAVPFGRRSASATCLVVAACCPSSPMMRIRVGSPTALNCLGVVRSRTSASS